MQNNKRRLIILILLLICTFTCVISACNDQNTSKATYIISFNSNGGTTVDTVHLKEGDSLPLPAHDPVKKGYVFIGWFLDSACTQQLNVSTFKAKRNLTIFAGWESVETYRHAITVVNSSPNDGTVEVVEPEDKRARKGDKVVVEIKCNTGFIVKEDTLKANGVQLTQSEERSIWYEFIMPAEPVTVTCEFEAQPLEVTIFPDLANGTIIPSAEYARLGDQVTLLIVPDYGYKLKKLYFIGGEPISILGLGNIASFYMGDAAVVIGAEFDHIDSLAKYAVETTSEGAGTFETDVTNCEAGKYVNINATPANGYRLARLVVNYGSVRAVLSGSSFIMPESDVTVKAVFVPIGAEDNNYELTLTEPQNGKINIINRKNFYKSGEIVSFTATPNSGYVLDGVYANGSYVNSNAFRMPSDDCNLTAKFIKRGNSIKVKATDCDDFSYSLSTETAFPGDRVYIDIIPKNGFILNYSSLALSDGTPIKDGSFIMPEGEAEVFVEVLPAGADYIINIPSFVGGMVTADQSTAKQYQSISLFVTPNKGYALKKNGLTLSYETGAGTLGEQTISNNAFYMPAADVTVNAVFERIYDVKPFDDGKIHILPSSSTVRIGQTVQYTIASYGDYLSDDIRLCVNIGSYQEVLDSSCVFVMTASKALYGEEISVIALSESYKKIDKLKNYSVTVRSAVGGQITTQKSTGVITGTRVTLEIVPDDGYELESLKLNADGSMTTISDVFIMPDCPAEIIATFKPKSVESYVFGLKNAYDNNFNGFENCGFELSYLRERYQISDFFGTKIESLLGYLNATVVLKNKIGHDIFVFEVNNMSEISRLSYALSDIIDGLYTRDYRPSVYIQNGYITISPDGNAKEDWQLFRNGTVPYGNFIVYQRSNGTYGLFAYSGKSKYVCIPQAFNGRTISYVAPYAFRNADDIEALDIADVSHLDNFALCGLNKIASIDLRNISEIGKGVFKGCTALATFTIPSTNTNYNVQDGILFNASGNSLIAYPASKAATEYSLPTKVTKIDDYAFYGALYLEKIGFGGALARIGNYAFAECVSIKTICHYTLTGVAGVADFASNKSALTHIGDYAFNGTPGITTFNLDTVTYIGKYAFKVGLNGRLSLDISANRALPTAYFDIVETPDNGAFNISVNASHSTILSLHPIWSKYSRFVD